jgi:hypothetical protein
MPQRRRFHRAYPESVTAEEDDLTQTLDRVRELTATRDRAAEEKVRQQLDSGEVDLETLHRNDLVTRLARDGVDVEVSGLGARRRLPSWVDGLSTDVHAAKFDFAADSLDRATLDRCLVDVGEANAPKLLRDMHDDRHIDLTDVAMAGVAQVWSLGEPWKTGLEAEVWLDFFCLNGFTYQGAPAARPDEPVELFRGTTEAYRLGMSWSTDLAVARSFAYDAISNRPRGNIYTACVEPQYLLAYINEGHSENEWVVDPAGLRVAKVALYERG